MIIDVIDQILRILIWTIQQIINAIQMGKNLYTMHSILEDAHSKIMANKKGIKTSQSRIAHQFDHFIRLVQSKLRENREQRSSKRSIKQQSCESEIVEGIKEIHNSFVKSWNHEQVIEKDISLKLRKILKKTIKIHQKMEIYQQIYGLEIYFKLIKDMIWSDYFPISQKCHQSQPFRVLNQQTLFPQYQLINRSPKRDHQIRSNDDQFGLIFHSNQNIDNLSQISLSQKNLMFCLSSHKYFNMSNIEQADMMMNEAFYQQKQE